MTSNWEEIDVHDIKKGDIIRVVSYSDAVKTVTEGKAHEKSYYGSIEWDNKAGVSLFEYFDNSTDSKDKVLRRKKITKPKEVFGRIIRGQAKDKPDAWNNFVWDGKYWSSMYGVVRTTHDLKEGYQNFRLISKGVKKDWDGE